MKGNTNVLGHLNALLGYELAARDQYFIHSRMYEDWGFAKLYERINHEMEDETEHASKLIQRILFLEGTPEMVHAVPFSIGSDVPEMLKNDLGMEISVVDGLRKAIQCCEQEQDFETREILGVLLDDTEQDHVFWLEIQLGLIDRIGIQNYLQSQM